MVRIQGGTGSTFLQDRILADYLEDIDGNKPLTRSEEMALFRRIRSGDHEALNELVRANLKFVISVCANYRNQGVPLVDLVGEGNLGLIRAAHRFDATLDNRFISYAVWWVRQAILNALAAQSRLFPVSTNRANLVWRVERTSASLRQSLGREPSAEEIAEAGRISLADVEDARKLNAPPCFLDHPEGGDIAELPDEECEHQGLERPERAVRRNALGKVLESMLQDLSERDREIVRLFHGLGLETDYCKRDIGSIYGLSRYQVTQILKKAVRTLRESPEAAILKRVSATLAG